MKVLGRLLLVVALLFAQTGGVAHELWHAASLTADDGDAKAPQKSVLCDFHTALSAVLGAVDGSSHAGSPEVQPAVAFAGVDVAITGRSSLTARSRGPPTLL